MALQLNSVHICENHIIKGFLFIYLLLAQSHLLQHFCFPNHLAILGCSIGPAKVISKSCNHSDIVLYLL